MNLCDDNRTATIEAAKMAIIKGTNIEDSPEEMKVLNSFLLRCWQMGWLDRYAPPRHFNAMPKVISERLAAGHGSNVPMKPNIPPMPSNTSNALKALNSVNATRFDALDALADAYKGRSNALENQTKWNRMMLHLADLQLTYSPDWGANGQGDQKLYDFVTELIDEFSGWDVPDTNVGEMITKQQVIDVLERVKRTADDILYDGPVLMTYNDVLDSMINIVNLMPAVQQKIIHCKDCKHFKSVFAPNDNDGLCGHWHSKCDARTNRNGYCSHAERREVTT